tara:strand:+ start:1086 stop:1835 length:750 start_codon:yes stop_codon:yes gene_type:complete
LTIITPVLNDLEGLILCCNSIGLSEGEFEHIIVDGLSTDGSFEYAQKLSERPFTDAIKQTSPSIYGAFNDGLEAAKGEYVIYLHCGDELNLDAVMSLVRDSDGCDLIAASCSQKSRDDILNYHRSERNKISVDSMSILQPSLIVRRARYEQVGRFDCDFKISADVDCILKILKVSDNVRYVDDLVVHMEEFGLSQAHYFKKLREHTLIKYRHGGLIQAFNHIPMRLLLDFAVIPLWVRVNKFYPKFMKR